MSKMKALIPNLLTAGNLVGGVLAIIFSLTGRLEWAPYCIFISAFLDFFDGFAARLLKVQSELGKQLDSLADMVTFGVAPGVIVFMMLKIQLSLTFSLPRLGFNTWSEQIMEIDLPVLERIMAQALESYIPAEVNIHSEYNLFTWIPLIALLIPVFSMFRLAKFNLDTRQSDSFIGVPTPANTLFFVSIPLILIQFSSAKSAFDQWIFQLFLNPWFLIFSSIVMSILLISELPLFALKFKSFGWKGNEIRYIFLTLAVILLATLWWLAIPLIIILYILLSLIQNLRHKTAAAKTSK